MKKHCKVIILILLIVMTILLVIKFSYATASIITSSTYEIRENVIYAVPTSNEFKVSEFFNNLEFMDEVKVYNSDNQLLNIDDYLGTGSTLKISSFTFNIVVLGDVTGDGLIEIGDVSKLYNHYRGNKTFDGYYLEAGKLTENDNVTIGDISKLYNFFRGKKAFTYYKGTTNIQTKEEVETYTLSRVNEIRNTPNTDISSRTGNIYYVSNDGDDSNDGLSPEHPFKTLEKIGGLLTNNKIPASSTVLFRDGDTFRGSQFFIKADDILIGSYGDISKGKPTISKSLYDGAKEGTWTEIKTNIWKYEVNGSNPFTRDVGEIWLFCNEGNNNCNDNMPTLDKTFSYTEKIYTQGSYDETNIEDKIDTLLTEDLQFYHTGHASASDSKKQGGAIYLYSTSNPAMRFDEIEFSSSGGICFWEATNGAVDNIKLVFAGNHGVNAYTMANFKITNSEFGFIGGSVQSYSGGTGNAIRYGNAIEVYGSIKEENNIPVSDGFIVDNNYIYQVFDAGATFQVNSSSGSIMEKAKFTNNIIEYANYNIEYWMYASSKDPKDSYIKDFLVEDNVLRYSGYGFTQTRNMLYQSGLIKTWFQSYGNYNNTIGNYIIKNNIFSDAKEYYVWLKTNKEVLPKMINNKFFGKENSNFGFIGNKRSLPLLKYKRNVLENNIPYNTFYIENETPQTIVSYINDQGTSNQVEWTYDSQTGLLRIDGTGKMEDYTSSNLPPWYQYKDKIYKIEVGENVTKIGKYAFYNLTKVADIRIDAIKLSGISASFTDGKQQVTSNQFANMGLDVGGVNVVFGPKVTTVPGALFDCDYLDKDTYLYINSVRFEGNNVTSLEYSSLQSANIETLKIPEGVTKVSSGVVQGQNNLKFLILPNTLVEQKNMQAFYIEKIVFGPSISGAGQLFDYHNSGELIAIIPHVEDPSNVSVSFRHAELKATIYGDDSTLEWINNVKNKVSTVDITYHPLDEYVSTITSNTNINATVGYNGTYTFETDKEVTIQMYYDATNGKRYFVDADYTKEGNQYTITNIKSDVYIEIK